MPFSSCLAHCAVGVAKSVSSVEHREVCVRPAVRLAMASLAVSETISQLRKSVQASRAKGVGVLNPTIVI